MYPKTITTRTLGDFVREQFRDYTPHYKNQRPAKIPQNDKPISVIVWVPKGKKVDERRLAEYIDNFWDDLYLRLRQICKEAEPIVEEFLSEYFSEAPADIMRPPASIFVDPSLMHQVNIDASGEIGNYSEVYFSQPCKDIYFSDTILSLQNKLRPVKIHMDG